MPEAWRRTPRRQLSTIKSPTVFMERHALSVHSGLLHPSQDEVPGRIRTPFRRFNSGHFSIRRRARRRQVGKLQGIVKN